MDFLLETYYVILPIIVSALMGYVVWVLENTKKNEQKRLLAEEEKAAEEDKKRQAAIHGTCVILLYMLERLYTEYKMQNFITKEQRDNFYNIYQTYHELGGNGYGTALCRYIDELEIRNDVETISPYAKLLKEAYAKGRD